MLIVDAQVHIWAAHSPERPWPEDGFGREHSPVPLTAEKLLTEMDEAGVDRAVLVPPSFEGDRNDLALEAAGRHPGRFAVMGRIDLGDPANAALLPTWREQPRMLGIRVTFIMPEHRRWLAEGVCDWFWPAAEESGIPVMVLPPEQFHLMDPIIERHPGINFVMDHLGMNSKLRDVEAFAAVDELLPLARHPNLAVKASALPCYTTEKYPFRGIHDHIKRVLDAFGPERTFWGTDVSRLPCTYREGITFFTEELPFLSESDKELVMGRAICDWLGWRI